jgi:vitamin B12/bleomycin/antimicrobial peptide transport system ATP-binding/permease protein
MNSFVVALRTFLRIAMPYFRSEQRWQARGLLLGGIGAELSVVYLAVLVNQWHGRFFNAIEARDWDTLRHELVIFLFLTVGAMATGMAQFFFAQMLIMRWREWMTVHYLDIWMADSRHYRVRLIAENVDNIHLRIASDILLFIQRTQELGSNLLSSVVSLFSFAYILWGISALAPLPLFGFDFSFPGYLIVGAVGYASLGMVFAHFIGHPLIPLNFMQQRREADFRFAIARVTDHAEPVALMRGEAVERGELKRRFSALVRNWTTLIFRQNRLNGFVFGYYHVSTVLPTLLVTPAYMLGAIPLGILMQAAAAFQKVESALAFCTQYAKIAEWKAYLDRVALFDAAMRRVDESDACTPALERATSAGHELTVSGLDIRLANGEPIAQVPDFKLAPGQKLLVSGPSGAGKSSLFRALAGIWPLGQGRIALPQGARVLALPQRPYFPLGSLRQGITYPLPGEVVDDGEVRAAMAAAGLPHLTERLDEEADWSTALSGGEQQRIGFARALINQPTVLLLDEAASTLEDAEARELYTMLADKLPSAIVISTGRAAGLVNLHPRSIEMTASPAAGGTRGANTLAPVPA